MTAIYLRELKSFFHNLTGFIYSGFMLFFAGIFIMAVNFTQQDVRFEYAVANMSFVLLLAVPVLTMRILSEERKQKIDRLYYSLPVSMMSVVMGKYLATLTILAVPVAVMGLYPIVISAFGSLTMLTIYGTLFGFFMLGAALVSVGMFISSLTENQIIAAVITLVVILINYYIGSLASLISSSEAATFAVLSIICALVGLILYFMTKNYIAGIGIFAVAEAFVFVLKNSATDAFSTFLPNVMQKIALFDRFYSFPDGVFDISAIIFYLGVIAIFVFLTVQAMEKRRWS